MTIETELMSLVKHFHPHGHIGQNYTAQLSKEDLLSLENKFIRLVQQQLLVDGVINKSKIKAHYKHLALLFDPATLNSSCPEIQWIDQALSDEGEPGACSKLLHFSYKQLVDPNSFKQLNFRNINTLEEGKNFLRQYKSKSATRASKYVCDSLIDLAEESTEFFDSAGKIKPQAIKRLIQAVPPLIAGFGTTLFFEELFIIHAIYFILLTGGKKLGKSHYKDIKQFGNFIQDGTCSTAMITTAFIARIIELIFWVSKNCLLTSLGFVSKLFPEVDSEDDSNTSDSERYTTPEFNLIATPFEMYLKSSKSQLFRYFRPGALKKESIDSFLFHLKVLDHMPTWSIDQKYQDILERLQQIKTDPLVYAGKTKDAVDYVESVIDECYKPSSSLENEKKAEEDIGRVQSQAEVNYNPI